MSRILPLIAALALGACTSPLTGAEVEAALAQTLSAARAHHEAGRDVEAAHLLEAMTAVDPAYPGLAALDDQVPTLIARVRPGLLGSNVRPRERVDAGVLARALWYLPDRVLDLLDIVSFDVHVGLGVLVNVHATRAVQLGAGARSVVGVGWHDFRNLGLRTQAEAGLELLAAGAQGVSAVQLGTSGVQGGSWSVAGLHAPGHELYLDARDYWAVGAQLTAGVAGVDLDLHPVEAFDALVGFLLFDPLHDDFATTTGLDLDARDRRALRKLQRAAVDADSLASYRRFSSRDSARDG